MTMLEAFVKERNEALFSLDRKKIEAYMIKYGETEISQTPNVIQLKVNSESQHTETVKKIVCAGFYAKKGNGNKAEKEIREKRTIQKQEIMILYKRS